MKLGMSGVNMAGQACQQAIMDMKSHNAPLNTSLGNICQLEVCDRSEGRKKNRKARLTVWQSIN